MSDKKIEDIVEELRSEEERIKNEIADLKKMGQDLSKELKAVQSGLAALTGKPRKKGATRKAAAPAKSEPEPTRAEPPVHSGAHNGSLPQPGDDLFR